MGGPLGIMVDAGSGCGILFDDDWSGTMTAQQRLERELNALRSNPALHATLTRISHEVAAQEISRVRVEICLPKFHDCCHSYVESE